MVGIELQMINPIFFSPYLTGRCHGKKVKMAFFTDQSNLSRCHSEEKDCNIAIPISNDQIK